MHKLRVCLFVLLLAGCASESEVYVPPPPPPDPHTQMAALEIRVFDLIQAERLKADPGAKPLALDSELVGVARKRSADMAAKGYMNHTAPDGSTSASIIMDEDVDFQGLLGENIAAQYYRPQLGVDVDAFARRFVDIWMNSPDHRKNILTPVYQRSGVGAAVNGDTVYVVQLFATDLGLPPPPHPESKAPPAAQGSAVPVPVPRPKPGK
jgi:uncharacterized protein YkwD